MILSDKVIFLLKEMYSISDSRFTITNNGEIYYKQIKVGNFINGYIVVYDDTTPYICNSGSKLTITHNDYTYEVFTCVDCYNCYNCYFCLNCTSCMNCVLCVSCYLCANYERLLNHSAKVILDKKYKSNETNEIVEES